MSGSMNQQVRTRRNAPPHFRELFDDGLIEMVDASGFEQKTRSSSWTPSKRTQMRFVILPLGSV